MRLPKRQASHGNGVGSDKYLKLQPGESVNGVFVGEPYEFYQIWPKGGEKQIFDEPTAGAQSRFKLNFVTVKDKVLTALVFEFGMPTYSLLAEINETYPLEKTKVKVTRNGSGTATKYTVLPLLNAQDRLNAAMVQKVESIPLNLLDHGKGRSNGVQETPSAPEWGDPMPEASDFQGDESSPDYPQF